jgi:hypothetical protein
VSIIRTSIHHTSLKENLYTRQRWAQRVYATMYPIWYNNIIVSREVNKYWKAYEKHDAENAFPDDRIAELIRFRNHYDRPMYPSEFQYMMKMERKKLGYHAGEWKGTPYQKAYYLSWQQVNGEPRDHIVEYDRDFTSSAWFMDYHIGHLDKPVDKPYSKHWGFLQVRGRIPINRFPQYS